MNIKPVKTKKDYQWALQRIDALMDAKKNTKEAFELDVLAMLVEAYEERHFVIDDPDPIAAIEHRMEALGMERKDLVPILGSKSRVSEVMNKKRPLTMNMVRNLHNQMGIPAHTLIQDYDIHAV